MQCHVDGGMIGVCEYCALIDRQIGVGVAQNQCGDAAAFEFLAQAACESHRYVFFEQ